MHTNELASKKRNYHKPISYMISFLWMQSYNLAKRNKSRLFC